jgi:hypothetical protein
VRSTFEGVAENWGLRALRMLTAGLAPRRSLSRSRVSLLRDGRRGGVPGNGDAVRGEVTGGLARGGEAPGGRDASEEEREEVKGTSLGGSGALLGSAARTCQLSSSDEGVVVW